MASPVPMSGGGGRILWDRVYRFLPAKWYIGPAITTADAVSAQHEDSKRLPTELKLVPGRSSPRRAVA